MENSRGNSAPRHGNDAEEGGGITRRRALTVTGGMIAGAALAAQAFPAFGAESQDADAIVVGHGLAGLVATAELAAAGRKVLLLDQEPETGLGGQAFWSFGGLFLVNSPEQRRLRIKDSPALIWEHVDDVQLLVNYRYWSRVDKAFGQ